MVYLIFKYGFYSFWLSYLIFKGSFIINPRRYAKMSYDLYKKMQKGDLNFSKLSPEQKPYMLMSIIAIIFRFIGLLSFNWTFFLIWIIVSLIEEIYFKELMHRDDFTKVYSFIFYTSISDMMIGTFIVLNTFHLFISGLDFYTFFFGWI